MMFKANQYMNLVRKLLRKACYSNKTYYPTNYGGVIDIHRNLCDNSVWLFPQPGRNSTWAQNRANQYT